MTATVLGRNTVRCALVIMVWIGSVSLLQAQPTPYLGEIAIEVVPCRCGPSDQMAETGQLFKGTRVLVEREEPSGWLAIQSPRGQVSWINHKYLAPIEGQPADAIPRNAIVTAEPEAEIAYGRPGATQPLDVRRTKVPDQTVVLIIGKKVEFGGSFWWPIEPPEGDYRYIPKSAVRFIRGQANQGFVVRSPTPEPAAPSTGGTPVTASIPNKSSVSLSGGKPADWPNHPLWLQAEQAERNGDYAKAESLYLRLAAEMNQTGGDADLANLCYTRVHSVREKMRQGRNGNPQVTESARRGDTGSGRSTSSSEWIGPGSLRPAGFKIEGRTTYALVNAQGKVIVYALPGPGVDLDRYRGTEVELYGNMSNPGDLRGAGVVTALKVQASR